MKRILILGLILGLLLSGCWTVPEPPDPPEPNGVAYRALCIGVGDYINYTDLRSPKHNVAKMVRIFSKCKFTEEEIEFIKIETLIDLDATKENILQAIVNTFADADENDINYFYWNGHGSYEGEPYICPTDFDGTKSSYISVHELEELLSSIPGAKVVLLDTCYSGSFIGKERVRDLLDKDGYYVITSCRGDQVCWENQSAFPPYCYFTMGIYQGSLDLKADDNKDGIINLTELWSYARDWAIDHRCQHQYAQYFPEGSTFPIVEY